MDYLKYFLMYEKCPQLLTGIYVACELLSIVVIRNHYVFYSSAHTLIQFSLCKRCFLSSMILHRTVKKK